MSSVLHMHKFGHPWTDHLKVFKLSSDLQQILYKACQTNNVKLLQTSEFLPLWNEIGVCIKEHGPMFFKLSSISAKDSYFKSDEPLLKATNAEKLFNVFVTSMRICEELEDEDDFAIILTPWNDKIKVNNEYRCFIFYGICEAIAKLDEGELTPKVDQLIRNYIQKHLHLFPSQTVALDLVVTDADEIIFIEFNPMDDELDTYGILRRGVSLSEKAMKALCEPPKKY